MNREESPWFRPYVVSIMLREREDRRASSKGRATLVFVLVCVSALAFVAGMSLG